MEISLIQIIAPVLAIGFRVSGLMIFAPFFGSNVIPMQVKAMLTIALTAVLYPMYSSQVMNVSLVHWPLVIGSELLVGVAIGLTTNVAFEAAQLAGQILSTQMGYSLVNILDPTTQVESTVMAAFHQTLAMLIFLGLNVHQWIVRAVANSFTYLPPGTAVLNPMFVQALIHEGGAVLETGLQIAAPVLGATLLADIVLGLLSKASPQLPVMLLGTALKSMLGIAVLLASLHYWPGLFERYFRESISYTEQVLHLARS